MPSKNIQTWKDLNKKKAAKGRFSRILSDDTLPVAEDLAEVYEQPEFKLDKNLVGSEKNEEANNHQPEAKAEFEAESKSGEEKKPAKQRKLPQAFRVRWLLLITLLGSLVAWAAGWWFFTVASPRSGGVEISLAAPTQVISGGQLELAVRVKNNERATAEKVELNLQWPAGVKVVQSDLPATNQSNNSFLLPDIRPAGVYDFKIFLQVFGEENETKAIGANLIYELANFSSIFFSNADLVLTIGTAKLKVDFSGPPDVTPLTPAKWQFVLTNQSADQIANAAWEILVPPLLTEIKTKPATEVLPEKNWTRLIFPLDGQKPAAQQTIELEGSFAAGSQGKQVFIWQLVEDFAAKQAVTQEGQQAVYVIGDEVELTLTINGSESLETLSWGDLVDFGFSAKNITSQDLQNIEWQVTLTPEPFEWNTLATINTVVQERAGLVKLAAESNEELKLLSPGKTSKVGFQVRLKNQAVPANLINITARLQATVGDGSGADKVSFTKEWKNITIKNPIVWHASARYYDDEGIPVGSGPLPPVVGEVTTYRVMWNISDKADNVDRIVLATSLPPNTLWANQFNANQGVIRYQSALRQVEWTLTSVDDYDLGQGELEAWFDVRVVPNEDLVGLTVPLTSGIDLQIFKTDNSAKAYSKPMLTSALEGDLYASGKGLVKERE